MPQGCAEILHLSNNDEYTLTKSTKTSNLTYEPEPTRFDN